MEPEVVVQKDMGGVRAAPRLWAVAAARRARLRSGVISPVLSHATPRWKLCLYEPVLQEDMDVKRRGFRF